MNCARCDLELFDHPIDRIDRSWGESTCYLNGSHYQADGSLHPPHLTPLEFDTYAGFYQGLAWTQGRVQGPLTTNTPDELMTRFDPIKFDLRLFMDVVSEFDDEGGIHYWSINTEATTMTLWCTEDEVPSNIPDSALHAASWVTLARA
jgi:hypothetical protein